MYLPRWWCKIYILHHSFNSHTLKFHSAFASVFLLFWEKTTKHRTFMVLNISSVINKEGTVHTTQYCGLVASLLLPWTHRNAFSLYRRYSHAANNNVINTESVTREEQPCTVCIVALHISLPTSLHVNWATLLTDYDKIWIFSTDFRKSRQHQISRKSSYWQSRW
jgi:hypothetical protein